MKFNPATFYWSAFTKPEKWTVIYLCWVCLRFSLMFFNQISLSFERIEQFLSMNVLLQFACINFDISTLLIIALSYGTTGSKNIIYSRAISTNFRRHLSNLTITVPYDSDIRCKYTYL